MYIQLFTVSWLSKICCNSFLIDCVMNLFGWLRCLVLNLFGLWLKEYWLKYDRIIQIFAKTVQNIMEKSKRANGMPKYDYMILCCLCWYPTTDAYSSYFICFIESKYAFYCFESFYQYCHLCPCRMCIFSFPKAFVVGIVFLY
jgi:hypothetical protein